MPPTEPKHRRTLRSFVRRQGRLTSGQQHALNELFPRFGVDEGDIPIDLPALFGNHHPVILEIGFGNGESLAQNAQDNPGQNYFGIEVHRPGVGHLLMRVDELQLANIRVCTQDAVDVIEQRLPPACLAGVQIFFPDPWPKKRHHKRRLIQAAFLDSLARVIQPGGSLHLATDWENYAEHMLAVADAHPAFTNTAGQGRYSPRPPSRPLTKFEQRGQRLGHGVYDLILKRNNNQESEWN